MLDKKYIQQLEKHVEDEDKARELILATARTILKNSKSAIYSIHRNALKESKQLLDEAAKTIKQLRPSVDTYPQFKYQLDMALEEYCEAMVFYIFITKHKLLTHQELQIDPLVYLSGLSDFTGELGRMAVIKATARDEKTVKNIRDIIDEIHGLFLKFDLRNGDLRKKSDSIKWNLNKVEELLYDLKKKK